MIYDNYEQRQREQLEEQRHRELVKAASNDNWLGYVFIFILLGGGGAAFHGGGDLIAVFLILFIYIGIPGVIIWALWSFFHPSSERQASIDRYKLQKERERIAKAFGRPLN